MLLKVHLRRCRLWSRDNQRVLEKLVKHAKQTLDLCIDIPAFSLPKGPNCILPIFLHGLMYGNHKEEAALGIADIIDKTPAENLRPFSTSITGPLIRVIGEKVASDIKAAILVALNNLLLKIPQFLRPFIPQLQEHLLGRCRTAMKSYVNEQLLRWAR